MNWISILVPLGTVFANPVTYAMCGTWMWNTHGMAMRAIVMHGTSVGTRVQLTCAIIHQQLSYKNMSNSVHNCESNTCSAFTESCTYV